MEKNPGRMLSLITTLAGSVLSALAELGRAVLAALVARMSPSLTSVTSELTTSAGTKPQRSVKPAAPGVEVGGGVELGGGVEYRAEGNANLVVAVTGTGTVLRLPKSRDASSAQGECEEQHTV